MYRRRSTEYKQDDPDIIMSGDPRKSIAVLLKDIAMLLKDIAVLLKDIAVFLIRACWTTVLLVLIKAAICR